MVVHWCPYSRAKAWQSNCYYTGERLHLSFSNHQGDIRGAFPGWLKGLQREWTDVMATMAVLTLLLEDRRHIPGERWRIFPPGRLITQD